MTLGMEKSAHDTELSRRVREGDRSAVRELLERDHAVASLFACVTESDGDPQSAVERAWEQLFADVLEGTVHGGLRAALLMRVAGAIGTAAGTPRPTRQPSLGTFTAAGDRWEGWWDNEPPAWPTDTVPRPDQLLRVLRRLPPQLGELLVLRDVARLSEAEAAGVVGNAVDGQSAILESAEDAYLVELDREMGSA